MPFPTASPAFVRPVGLDDIAFVYSGGGVFLASMPSQPGEEVDTGNAGGGGKIYSPINDNGQLGWEGTVLWQPVDTTSLEQAAQAVEASERQAGTLVGTVTDVDWAGVPAKLIRRGGTLNGRPFSGAMYMAEHQGIRVSLTINSYADVPRADAFKGIETSILTGWRWR
jgi:hypothetical protein